MPGPSRTFRPCVATLLLLALCACAPTAGEFFSGGRNSMLAEVHREAIESEKKMLALYRVPARFPEATTEQRNAWQQAVAAWWWAPAQHELMLATFPRLDAAERETFFTWLRLRDPKFDKGLVIALGELETALLAVAPGK